jgi:polyhydroxybutyrate depolymerase
MNHPHLALVVSFLVLLGGAVAAGCGRAASAPPAAAAAPLGPGDHERRIQWDGRARSYRIHVPPSYAPGRPTPLVLNFHGGGGNAADQEKNSVMNATADARGFIVVYPNGTGPLPRRFLSFNAGMCCGYAQKQNIDDVGFVRAMLDDLQRVLSIDPARVYATGFSNGAMLTHRLACEMADRIAAIAPVGAPIGVTECRPSRPVPVLQIHGTADPAAPFHGGQKKALVGREIHDYRPVPETVEGWARRNQCAPQREETLRRGAVTCETHTRCAAGATVSLCVVQGGGHTWPGGQTTLSERVVGPLNRDISASDVIWEFFAKHALR